jgi:hypothetical protein
MGRLQQDGAVFAAVMGHGDSNFGRDKTRERAMMWLFPIENCNDVLFCAGGWR